jgi:PTS system mannose-specific IIB component
MINHFRVDSKLIHGQITTRLLAFKHCNRILLIDDTVAGDESMRNIFSTVIPHSVKIHFRGMGDALNALERAQASANRYLVIVRTPETALALLRQGYAFGCTLTCGQLTNDRGNGIPVLKGVNLLPEDIAAFRELSDSGVVIVFDPNASEGDAVSWKNVQKTIRTQGGADTQGNAHANLLRVFGILDLFLEDPTLGLTPNEIQARLQIPFSTTYRLVSFLEKNGYLEKDKITKDLHLGWKFLKMQVESGESRAHRLFHERIIPALHVLTSDTGEASAVFVPYNQELRCMAHFDSPYAIAVRFTDEQTRAVGTDAVGEAVLCTLGGSAHANSDTSAEATAREPEKSAGGVFICRDQDDGSTSIAAPVMQKDRLLCILTIQGPSFRFKEDALARGIEDLERTVKSLSSETDF